MKRIYERIVVSDVPPTSGDIWIDTSGNVPILKTGSGFEWKSPISPSDDGDSDDDDNYGKYFTIEATQDGTTVYFRQSSHAVDYGLDPLKVEVSTDNGATWAEVTAAPAEGNVPGATLAELDEGEKALIRGRNEAYGYFNSDEGESMENCNFYADSPCYIYGNIMSLIGGDDFARLREVKESSFAWFFSDYSGDLEQPWVLSKQGEKLLLPATTLSICCYCYMFQSCTSLTSVPELPATTLAESCYDGMFAGCTSLTSTPELPATTLANNCYDYMFSDCTGLTTAPELPATTLADKCYRSMFEGCTSLTTAPELPALTLVDYCYGSMFRGCTNLAYIKAMFTTTPGLDYTGGWLSGVNATGTFVKNSAATWDVTGGNGVPTGWTVTEE